MRRVTLILLGATLALIILSPAAFSDETTTSGADSQYDNEETTVEESTVSETDGESTEPEITQSAPPPKPISEATEPVSQVSQGSVYVGPGLPEENFPPYSQVVDNATKRNFKAPGWKRRSSLAGHYGEDYAVARTGKKRARAAQYRVKIPATDKYSVYAWLPANGGNTPAARFGVTTTSGTRWTRINQQKDGGFWTKIGEYRMRKGESYAIKIAPGAKGRTVADAVAVVRGVLSGPPEDESMSSGGDTIQASGSSSPTGKDVVRKARKYLNIKYKWGACTKTRMSCTCLTKKSFRPFGHDLPMSEDKQWRYAKNNAKRLIRKKANLRPGDLLFFKENGKSGGITHVGVYSGRGYLVHSSSYFGEVVESKMKYIDGFHRGARLKLR